MGREQRLGRNRGRTARGGQNNINILNLVSRLHVEDGQKANDRNEDRTLKVKPLPCPAEPRTQRGRMSGCLVVAVLDFMGDGRRRSEHRHQQQARNERQDQYLSSETNHVTLLGGGCLHRFATLNALNGLFYFVFGQEPALDVFLHDAFFIDEYTDG